MSIKRNNQTIAGTYSATTTASIAPSTDRNYVTDAEKSLISNLYFKPAYTITVGTGGDFALLSEALAYVANYSAVTVTVSLLNDITEATTIALNNLNSSSIIVEGNNRAVTFTTGTLNLNNCTNITLQNITINVVTYMNITGISNICLSNGTFTSSSSTSGTLCTNGLCNITSTNCTYTSNASSQYMRTITLSNGTNMMFTGTNTVNYLSGIENAICLESSNIFLGGALKIYGKSGGTTNNGIYLSQSNMYANYATTLTLTNFNRGVVAYSGARVAIEGGFTCTATSVTTLYNPAKNTTGNSNSYIQVP